MKTIKEMFDTLLSHDAAALNPAELEAVQEYNQAQYFANIAPQHHLDFVNKLTANDLSSLDQRNAMWNYLSAALRGHPQAQYQLGMAYFVGDLGLAKDYHLAEQWLQRAAERGHVGAQQQLNDMYQLVAFS